MPTRGVWRPHDRAGIAGPGLLADVLAQAAWNSTLASIEGKIAIGERVSFSVREAPRQTFSPRVVAYDEAKFMVWRLGFWQMLASDRTYRRTPGPGGSTEFSLHEVFRGLLLPVVARTFPDFGLVFERTAADLKAAAEAQTRATGR